MTVEGNLKEVLETINKMKKAGTLPSREELLTNFQRSDCLTSCNDWFLSCNNFLTAFRLRYEKHNNLEKYPFETVLYTHLIRMQRYMLGLSRLSWVDEYKQGITHSIDCYFPILKSVFELSIEFCLALAFRKEFGTSYDSDRILANRINRYAEFSRKKNNYQFYFSVDEKLRKDLYESMPGDIREYLNCGKTHAANDLKAMAREHFYQNNISSVKHWFPAKDRDGRKFGDKHPGTIQWCCVDVLEKYSDNKGIWASAYSTTYEMLNRYSHPVLGYDDNLRPTPERLFDLSRMHFNIVCISTMFIRPKMFEIFDIQLTSDTILKQSFHEMQQIEKKLFPMFLYFDLAINRQPYKNG